MIFINYRRDDTSGNAGRIFDRLAKRFGTEAVFRDVAQLARAKISEAPFSARSRARGYCLR
jgi:hypothetical protein